MISWCKIRCKMEWKTIKSQGQLTVSGTLYSVSHLQDATYHFTIPATDRFPALTVGVLVQYSSHCISWGPRDGEAIDFSVEGEDARIIDDKGIHRCFDPDRYQKSASLPAIFAAFVDRTCFFTGYENWLTVELEAQDGQGRIEYEIFFNLRRQSSAFLRLNVESAYVRTDANGNPERQFSRREKVRARTLLAKTLRGELIKPPHR